MFINKISVWPWASKLGNSFKSHIRTLFWLCGTNFIFPGLSLWTHWCLCIYIDCDPNISAALHRSSSTDSDSARICSLCSRHHHQQLRRHNLWSFRDRYCDVETRMIIVTHIPHSMEYGHITRQRNKPWLFAFPPRQSPGKRALHKHKWSPHRAIFESSRSSECGKFIPGARHRVHVKAS